MELVLCCDIVIANQFAKLGLPEIKLGLIPGGGGTQRSVAKLGRNRANFLLMTGAIVPASEFVDAGLVNEIVDVERLMPRALELADNDRRRAAAAIEGLKRLTAHAVSGDLADGLAMERDILGELYRSEIGQQRVRSSPTGAPTRRRRPRREGRRRLSRPGLGAWRADGPAARRHACARYIPAGGWPAGFADARRTLGRTSRRRKRCRASCASCAANGPVFPSAIRCLPTDGPRTGRVSWARRSRTKKSMAIAPIMTGPGATARAGHCRSMLAYPAGEARSSALNARLRPIRRHRPSTSNSRSSFAAPAACRSACTPSSGCRL